MIFKKPMTYLFISGSKLRNALRILLAGVLLMDASQLAFAALTKPDYSNFSIIPERNIFNTKRSPAYKPSGLPPPRQRPTDSLVLTGTMRDEKGPLAFFDGNSSEYRQVLKPNDSIAGFQIVEIEHAAVKLKYGTNEIIMPVNMQLAREQQGEWQLGQRSDSFGDVASNGSSRSASESDSNGRGDRRDRYRNRRDGESRRSDRSTPEPDVTMKEAPSGTGTNAAPASSNGASDTDILEILRRRREQENNQ
jgi:hypothetical protein